MRSLSAFGNRVSGTVSSRRRHARTRARSLVFLAEQLESRSMLSGIGVIVTPPMSTGPIIAPVTKGPVLIAPPPSAVTGGIVAMPSASVTTGPVSPVMIAPPSATGAGSAVDPPVTLPVIRDSLRIAMPAQARVGAPITVTVAAVDAAGRPLTSLNGSATVFSSDPAAELPLIPVTFRNGRASFQVTFATAGKQSVTVRSLDNATLSATARTEVTAAQVATRFSITLPWAVPDGEPVKVTIMAVDATGRAMPSHRGTATLTSTDPAATFPTTVTFVNGRATVSVTFATAGKQTLSVSQQSPSAPNGLIVGSVTTQVGLVKLGGSGPIVRRFTR